MSAPPAKIHPSDVGLPEPAVRKRRRSRRLARVMLTVAVLTAVVMVLGLQLVRTRGGR